MSDWITDYYRDVDGMHLQSYVDRHTDDAVVQFGNNPPAVGKDAVGQSMAGAWSAVASMRHERRNLWFVDAGTTAVVEFVAHYTTKGGAQVAIPCVSILQRVADGRIQSLRVYIDSTPLIDQIGAEYSR